MALINLNDPIARGNTQASGAQPVVSQTQSEVYVPSSTPLPTLPSDIGLDLSNFSEPQQEYSDVSSNNDFSSDNLIESVNAIPEVELQPVQINNVANTESNLVQQNTQGDLNLKTYDLPDIIEEAIVKGASDIHLSTGHRAIIRVDGELETLPSSVMTQDVVERYATEFLKNKVGINVNDITEIDVGYTFGKRRLRVNIFKQMGVLSIVARIIPERIPSLDELNLPAILKEFINIKSGFVLVTGPTGSGKSTTLAATLNYINTNSSKHIITLEDPVEFIFPRDQSLIDQRELGHDFESWESALKSMMRQDPDIVLVGEMRDHATISSAITLAETGHLVFATLHTNSAAQTVDRIIDVFPENQQLQIRTQLANVLTTVISQRLLPVSGGGRKSAMEIMIATSAVKNAIREGKSHQIDNMIQTGQDVGMISMEQSLVNLVRKGVITQDTAMSYSIKPDQLTQLLQR